MTKDQYRNSYIDIGIGLVEYVSKKPYVKVVSSNKLNERAKLIRLGSEVSELYEEEQKGSFHEDVFGQNIFGTIGKIFEGILEIHPLLGDPTNGFISDIELTYLLSGQKQPEKSIFVLECEQIVNVFLQHCAFGVHS